VLYGPAVAGYRSRVQRGQKHQEENSVLALVLALKRPPSGDRKIRAELAELAELPEPAGGRKTKAVPEPVETVAMASEAVAP